MYSIHSIDIFITYSILESFYVFYRKMILHSIYSFPIPHSYPHSIYSFHIPHSYPSFISSYHILHLSYHYSSYYILFTHILDIFHHITILPLLFHLYTTYSTYSTLKDSNPHSSNPKLDALSY